MKAPETLKTLQKLKVDCLYNKDTHFNASVRIQKEAYRFRFFLILGTVFASFSTIMNVGLWDKIDADTTSIQVIVNLLGALGGFFILYTTTFSDHNSKIDLASKHANIANNLNLLYKKVRTAEATFIDDLLNPEGLVKKTEEYSTEYYSICNSAPITLKEDFLKAKENFNNGYTKYTQQELEV